MYLERATSVSNSLFVLRIDGSKYSRDLECRRANTCHADFDFLRSLALHEAASHAIPVVRSTDGCFSV